MFNRQLIYSNDLARLENDLKAVEVRKDKWERIDSAW